MKPLVQTPPPPNLLALQKRWERNEKQSKGNEDACPLDTWHLWPSLKEDQDWVHLTLQNPEQSKIKAYRSENCCLPHPINCKGGKTGVLCKSKTNSLGLILLPRNTQRIKCRNTSRQAGATNGRFQAFPHLPSAELLLTHASLCFHNCSGTCFSSPINHYSLLREELEKAQVHTETPDYKVKIIAKRGTGSVAGGELAEHWMQLLWGGQVIQAERAHKTRWTWIRSWVSLWKDVLRWFTLRFGLILWQGYQEEPSPA